MTFRLGVFLDNAEVVDIENRGSTTVILVQARGLTKRACKRGARKEASSLIPLGSQNFINETQQQGGTLSQVWLFGVSDNGGA